ncbi:hypothetical protein QTO34_001384, partial [Cnephaeus nilssonii]
MERNQLDGRGRWSRGLTVILAGSSWQVSLLGRSDMGYEPEGTGGHLLERPLPQAEMASGTRVWIEDHTSHNIPLNLNLTQIQALNLSSSMKAKRGEEPAEEKFEASRGRFMRFKERSRLRNIKMQGEAASADVDAAVSYPEGLAKIINEGGYTQHQIFNNNANSPLPVVYKWNNKAWMTAHLFTTWYSEYFNLTVETYCSGKGIFLSKYYCPRALIEMYKINKKLIPTLTDDFEGFKSSVDKIMVHVMEIARETELEVEPEDVTELLQSPDNILMDKGLLLMDEQRKWFLEMDSTRHEDAGKIVEMKTNNLEYYINLERKKERIDSKLERSSVCKKLSNSIECNGEIALKFKLQQSPLPSKHHPGQSAAIIIRQDPPPAKRLQLTEGSDDVACQDFFVSDLLSVLPTTPPASACSPSRTPPSCQINLLEHQLLHSLGHAAGPRVKSLPTHETQTQLAPPPLGEIQTRPAPPPSSPARQGAQPQVPWPGTGQGVQPQVPCQAPQ